MVKCGLLIAVLAACQGQTGGDAPAAKKGSAALEHPAAPRDADVVVRDDAEAKGSDEPDQVDVGKAIAELGAIPAWQAVIDRAQYLARRGQHGVVFGTIGPPIMMPATPADAGLVPSPYVWLVDDTEGNGALAIRVKLGAKPAKQGDRLALGGAWALDDDRKWYWKVDVQSPLPPAAPTDLKDPPAQPGHTIVNGELPPGCRPISKADDGQAVYFQFVGAPPALDGDGWPVADELGNPVYALLNLPGETTSYGAQDLRSSDERWQLKRGQTYWVRIGIVHKHGPDKPATIRARTAPVRVM